MTLPLAKILRQEWDGITVEYGRLDAIGDFDFPMPQNTISVAFLPHDQVTWSVDGKPQQTNLPAGSIFLYGDRQFTWHQRHKPSEYVNLILDPALLQAIATDHNLPPTLQHRIIFQDPTILHIAQLLKTEILNGGIAGTLYVESLRNLLAVHLLRNHTLIAPALPTTALDPLKITQIKDYIEDHLAETLTLATLAALIPMSQFHFARAFKNAVGHPPHRYILQRRIDRAKLLLTLTPLTTAEVAYQVGFSNQSHLTAQFRKTVGITPKQFRESA